MARGKQDHKPTRKQKRMRPGQPKSKSKSNDSCPFLSLPPELIEAIVKDLPDLRSLSLTCRAFYHLYRLRLVVDRFEEGTSLDKVYCLEGAEEGEFGWKPFTIFHAIFGDRDYMEEEEADYVFLTCIEHDVAEYREDEPTRDYLTLEMSEFEIFLDFDHDQWFIDAPEDYHDWDTVIRGRLQRATPELLKKRFGPCPECKGREAVEYGSRDLAQRWPEIPQSHLPFDGPCPRCTFTYSYAVEYNREMVKEMEKEVREYMKEYEQRMMESYDDWYA
ncbi:hypothetical protein BCR35DRAFT_356122 [Leucosporidium creatinivorum]|uniref:F-box domain-containing protein n=1 Tax=Leucosporidium creatinivorum TaxID=106004 RepID=A0A1Y2CT06_9BASI|nr:hypothetical protein BCR35DRAFT_356122 [Leucosporidium creatinivorum]